MAETLNPQEQQPIAIERESSIPLYGNFEEALQTDEYEIALKATNELHELQSWRQATKESPFPQFYQLFEVATRINGVSASEKDKKILHEKIRDTFFPVARTLSPRVRDLYESVLAELTGEDATAKFAMTESQLTALKESGDLDILQDPSIPWNIKQNRMQNRIESELLGRKALDRREKKLQEQKSEERVEDENPPTPPPMQDESKPSMDEMSRLKEGEEAQAIWTITPGYGGYFKEQSFDTWDSERNTWKQSDYGFMGDFPMEKGKIAMSIKATIPGGKHVRLPIPYTYRYHSPDRSCTASMDKNGDFIIWAPGIKGTIPVEIFLSKNDGSITKPKSEPQVLTFPATLSPETERVLQEIKTKTTTIEKARALRTFTLKHLEYSNDSSYNVLYENYENGYIGAIDKFKKADCDVANTYFAALCSKLGIPVRHVVGHMVKGKDKSGNSKITSGTGHAWSEIWDDETDSWVRMDATPAGDPQFEQEQNGDESAPGDYGEGPEALMPTDQQLQELEEKLSHHTEMLSYTPEERRLSEVTGVDLREARQIVKEIQKAEDSRLPNGERVVDVMSQLFSLIIDSRKQTVPDYTGPVRKREGGEEIDDIVDHKIGIVGGNMDPASRRKEDTTEKEEKNMGGFDVYIIGDKSGSMSETVDGETKWELQRRAIYLLFSSLNRFEQNLKHASVRMTDPLSVRTQAISFRDSRLIDIDKELSADFSLHDKVKLWHSMGNQGMGNGDVPALNLIQEQIEEEKNKLENQGKEDDRLRIIIVCSDGMPDSTEGVHEKAQQLGELNAVVVGVGLTETASQVPIIFNTTHSQGDIAADINSLPGIVAKHIVTQAVKLFPQKAAPFYEKQVQTILAKFDNVGIR